MGGAFTSYGVDGEDLGWVEGTFDPEALACNPHGVAQAGIHALLLDASMNFAINAALPGPGPDPGHARAEDRDHAPGRARGTALPPAGRRGAAWPARSPTARPPVRDGEGQLVSRATGTFLLAPPPADAG